MTQYLKNNGFRLHPLSWLVRNVLWILHHRVLCSHHDFDVRKKHLFSHIIKIRQQLGCSMCEIFIDYFKHYNINMPLISRRTYDTWQEMRVWLKASKSCVKMWLQVCANSVKPVCPVKLGWVRLPLSKWALHHSLKPNNFEIYFSEL